MSELRYLEKIWKSEFHITDSHIDTDDNEDNSITSLYHTSKKYIEKRNDLEKEIRIFVQKNRSNSVLLKRIHIWKDWFLWSLRRIDWAYKMYIHYMNNNYHENTEDSNAPYKKDLLHIYCYTFLHNTKCLLEINKLSQLKIKTPENFDNQITNLRNLFAHEYNKNIDWRLYFITLNDNHYTEDIWIIELQAYTLPEISSQKWHLINSKTEGKYLKSIHFSLPYIYEIIFGMVKSVQ